jgi:hypothetical protein
MFVILDKHLKCDVDYVIRAHVFDEISNQVNNFDFLKIKFNLN